MKLPAKVLNACHQLLECIRITEIIMTLLILVEDIMQAHIFMYINEYILHAFLTRTFKFILISMPRRIAKIVMARKFTQFVSQYERDRESINTSSVALMIEKTLICLENKLKF